ncbi:hypothetical protein ACO2Q2_13335 [Dyella sp. KRB-257]|uniref:hypothetical protein n=1 Tax=Dyella sp. KRB-257 TaxID=3400915 RepID=UPI003C11CF42
MTAIPAWESGKTYPPGSLVVPASGTITVASQPTNADFESGSLTGWTDEGTLFAISSFDPYSGTYVANASGGGTDRLVSDTIIPCTPGDMVTVTAFAKLTNNGTDDLGAQTNIIWVDGTGTPVGTASLGNLIYGTGGFWTASTCSDRVPDGATGFKVGLGVNTGSHGGSVAFDHVYVSYVYAGPPLGIAYKAVQAASGKSGSTEPAWPGVLGETVVDNQVTWEAVVATRLVWKASPIMTSGATEPTWPTATGASVRDGTIDWVASTAQITDTNCPQSKIVQIAAGKVYAGDDDIVRYSATVNPKDWSTADDAGFLPFGMNTYGSNPVAAMDLYRSNLVPFNAEGFQMWQVDTDPANSSLLDAMPLACNYRRATSPVSTDLLFLTSEGVRSVGIAAASTNLEAGDVGMPIDDLVLPYLESLASDDDPLATYLPALGQYWLAFPIAGPPESTEVFVYTINRVGQAGKWSRYLFPFRIDNFATQDKTLLIRSGDDVLAYDSTAVTDYASDPREVTFGGIVQTPWLDMGPPGENKMLVGFDLVAVGSPSVAIGYDQSNTGTFTTDFAVPPDTVPGMIIPLPVVAPSMSVRITFAGGSKWKLQGINLYVEDLGT